MTRGVRIIKGPWYAHTYTSTLSLSMPKRLATVLSICWLCVQVQADKAVVKQYSISPYSQIVPRIVREASELPVYLCKLQDCRRQLQMGVVNRCGKAFAKACNHTAML